MSITVECQRIGCGEMFDVGMETDWASWPSYARQFDPFRDCDYGPSLVVAMPEGWSLDDTPHGSVIHCPEHAES